MRLPSLIPVISQVLMYACFSIPAFWQTVRLTAELSDGRNQRDVGKCDAGYLSNAFNGVWPEHAYFHMGNV